MKKLFYHVDSQVKEMLNQENWRMRISIKREHNVNSNLMVDVENRSELMVSICDKDGLERRIKLKRIKCFKKNQMILVIWVNDWRSK